MAANAIFEKYFPKLRKANLFCFVLSIILAVFSAFGTVSLLTINVEDENVRQIMEISAQGAHKDVDEVIQQTYGMGAKMWGVVTMVLFIVLVVLLFQAKARIKEEKLPSKLGYYLYVLLFAATIVYSVFKSGMNVFVIANAILHIVIALPGIFAIRYLFQLDEAPQEAVSK